MAHDEENLTLYLPAIHSILSRADLSTISAKAVRKELKTQYPTLDIKLHKDTIDKLTADAFQTLSDPPARAAPAQGSSSASKPKPKPAPKPKVKRERSESPPAAPKKKLAVVPKEETDAELAQRLHEEMNGGLRARTTRGAAAEADGSGKKKSAWGKKKKKAEGAEGEVKKRKPSNTGFNKPHALSEELAFVVGTPFASRPQITKKIWEYIKLHELQKPGNGMIILADEPLKRVLGGTDEVHGFKIAKHIGAHLYPISPEDLAKFKEEVHSEVEDED